MAVKSSMKLPERFRDSRPPKTAGNALLYLQDMLGMPMILGLGALLQLFVSLLFRQHFVVPILFILAPLMQRVLIYYNFIENPLMRNIAPGRTTGKIPTSHGIESPNGEFGVVQIGFRSNSALGLLDPTALVVSRNFAKMESWLYEHAEEAGFLTSEGYLGTRRIAQNTILVVLYFRTWHDIHRFAHGMHMTGWMEYARQSEAEAWPVEIWHESFMVTKSESIYLNTEPIGMGNAWQRDANDDDAGKGETKGKQWINGLQTISKKSTAKERIGLV